VVVRLLRELKRLYLKQRDHRRALWSVEWLLLLQPESPHELLHRGLLFDRLNCLHAALADYRHYLSLYPDDDHAPAIQRRLLDLAPHAGPLH